MPSRAGDELDDEIRRLYQGDLEGFVAARQELAKRRRQSGDERAAAVKELRKPSLSAWAVSRLFAAEPTAMRELVDGGERARGLAARSKPDPQALGELLAKLRATSEQLLALGVALLGEGGRSPGEAIVERLRANLDALTYDAGNAPLAARGWLDADLEPPGFAEMAALQVAAAGARPRVAKTPAAKGASSRPAAVNATRARDERLERARAEVARAEASLTERRRAVDEARTAAGTAERELIAAQRQADQARGRVRDAEKAAIEAEAALRRARAALDRA